MQLADKRFFQLLQLSTAAVFLGRAWQHLFWDAPYRALLWDQSLMEGVIHFLFNLEWKEYVSNIAIDRGIDSFKDGMGYFYLLCVVAALLINRFPRLSRPILWIGGVGLIILSLLYYKERFMAIGQFWEYTLQWSSPFFLLFLHRNKEVSNKMIMLAKVATALTFTCHGLYAIGYYTRPGMFVEMVINILGVSNEQAILFLNIAGIMDFVVSILIFFPINFAMPAMLYAVLWGFATSIARVWAYFHMAFWQESLMQWTQESVMRFPHFLIPLAILLYWYLTRSLHSQNVSHSQ
jgi:hypothetical protein